MIVLCKHPGCGASDVVEPKFDPRIVECYCLKHYNEHTSTPASPPEPEKKVESRGIKLSRSRTNSSSR